MTAMTRIIYLVILRNSSRHLVRGRSLNQNSKKFKKKKIIRRRHISNYIFVPVKNISHWYIFL